MKTKHYNFYLPQKMYDEVEKLAQEMGSSVADWLRNAIQEKKRNDEKK